MPLRACDVRAAGRPAADGLTLRQPRREVHAGDLGPAIPGRRTMVRVERGPVTSPDLTPIAACSLERDGMARRAGEFRALLAPALRGLSRSGATAELDLALDPAGERSLAALLALERECCPFWRFSLTRRSARRVRLRVGAEPPYEAALDAFLSLTR